MDRTSSKQLYTPNLAVNAIAARKTNDRCEGFNYLHHSPAVHSQASQYDNRPTTQHQKKSPVQDITSQSSSTLISASASQSTEEELMSSCVSDAPCPRDRVTMSVAVPITVAETVPGDTVVGEVAKKDTKERSKERKGTRDRFRVIWKKFFALQYEGQAVAESAIESHRKNRENGSSQFCQKNLGIGYDLESYVRVGGQGMKDLRMFRKYLSTRSWEESGEEILDYLLTQSWKVTLDIQHEMVDEGKKLVETNAGRELQAEIEKIKEAHKKEMLEIREDMEEAIKTQDTERQEELRG
ncbi:uncharacterized protein RSE6_00078 [Rhynchosporium secalis]|uniref:Uncharacterized protein n=1 Tax=Rhynchosporium secalis TaxID=38038 RepID=A0A1E1LUB5_RHYSE|nr:uncharacterized protein RSE6_00078 [Rhynchosporium secalis]